MKSWTGTSLILAVTLYTGEVPASREKDSLGAATVAIDILPGEQRNIVDREAPERVRVALLQTASDDVQAVDPETLRLGGAGIVKSPAGDTHAFEDVDSDGDLDLVVQFSAREIQLADGDAVATLEGAWKSGVPLRGTDRIQTLAAALANEPADGTDDEKLAALQATIERLPLESTGARVAVAMLGNPDLDVRAVSLRSIRLGTSGITKGPGGDLVAYRDVDGDGREDALVWLLQAAASKLEEAPALQAQTHKGRSVVGKLRAEGVPTVPPVVEGALEAGPEKGRYPLAIQIVDNTAASPYPASIQMSGVSGVVSKVRVTLNGLQHDCPNDLDVLLVGPNGQGVVVMSDVGGCQPFPSPSQLTLDDFSTATLSPGATPSVLGSYRPANNGAGDPFPAPASGQLAASALSAFNGINPNGTWKLYVVDDAPGGAGSIAQGWTLDLVTTTRFCNTVHVDIPDSGPGIPYPHNLNVSGLPRAISKVTVTLSGLTHTFADDVDVMLVGPGGQRIMLMSDVGGPNPVSNLQLTFDDDASAFLPDATGIPGAGSYRPTDQEAGDALPAPAPGGPYGALLGALRGSSPNGTWQLWVSDDAAIDSGIISGGWCIDLTTVVPAETCQPLAVTIPSGAPGVTSGPATPYPSTMHLEGTTGLVDYAEVRLLGLSHTFPDDLDIFLQAPFGKTVSLMSDGGGSIGVTNLDLRFTDLPIPPAPDAGPLGSGPYGVSNYEGGEFLPAPGPFASFTSFAGEVPNGDWRLWVADDAGGDVGSIAGGWCMNLVLREPVEAYCSTDFGPLTIPAGAPGNTAGVADPYPWGQNILERGSSIRKLQVTLFFNHTFPDDLDVLLVSPLGQTALLMSDAGGGTDFAAGSITFDDEAATPIPDETPLVNGATYRSANYAGGDGDALPPSAPAGPYGTDLSGFRGMSPLGSWFLYVLDDAGGDVGSASKWCINVFRAYASAEAKNFRWKPSPAKNSAEWDGAANATEYRILRGTPADLPSLLHAGADGCTAVTEAQQSTGSLTTIPAPGSFFWYLVVGASGNVAGPAGQARIGGIDTARSPEPIGACASP